MTWDPREVQWLRATTGWSSRHHRRSPPISLAHLQGSSHPLLSESHTKIPTRRHAGTHARTRTRTNMHACTIKYTHSLCIARRGNVLFIPLGCLAPPPPPLHTESSHRPGRPLAPVHCSLRRLPLKHTYRTTALAANQQMV